MLCTGSRLRSTGLGHEIHSHPQRRALRVNTYLEPGHEPLHEHHSAPSLDLRGISSLPAAAVRHDDNDLVRVSDGSYGHPPARMFDCIRGCLMGGQYDLISLARRHVHHLEPCCQSLSQLAQSQEIRGKGDLKGLHDNEFYSETESQTSR